MNSTIERVNEINFDDLEQEALDAFNGLAMVQNMIEKNKSKVVGGDPMLPGMPSELDSTTLNPEPMNSDTILEKINKLWPPDIV